MELFCYAAARVLLDSFPDAPGKLAAIPFSELSLRAYRDRLSRRLVLEKFSSLADGLLGTKDAILALGEGGPYNRVFSDKRWRQTTILMV